VPPTGERRWRTPQPIEQSDTLDPKKTYNASQSGALCVQGYPGWQGIPSAINGIEDCLLLDILVPQSPRSSALPVMLEIHGGGYAVGCSECYDGHALVQHSQGAMIYVTIQYRLGPYGFLASNEVRANGTANAGLLDQRAAIEWVHRHIAAFGGDPDQIVINGGSAGGGSVTAQLMLYGGTASRVFHAAIAEYPWWQLYHSPSIYEDQYNQLLNFTSCPDLACLRGVSDPDLKAAAERSYNESYIPDYLYGFGDFYYGPALDGNILRDFPSDAFISGRYTPMPLLTNRDGFEGTAFSNRSLSSETDESLDLKHLFPSATPEFFTELYNLYPASDFNATFWQRQQIFGDFIINCPTMWMSYAMSLQSQTVYKMIFDAGNQRHGADGPFLFQLGNDGGNATLADMMKDWYISFAVHLDPNAESWSGVRKPVWPVYLGSMDGVRGEISVMDVEPNGVGVAMDPDWSDRCMWWLRQSGVTTN
jgi:carboxylesterase type B